MIPISRAPQWRLAALVPLAALFLLQGCSSSGRAQTNNNAGTSTALSLTFCTGCLQGTLQPGNTTTINAALATDPNSQGVTWTLTGIGTLSNVTSSSVTYNAPPAASVPAGASTAVITATGVHDTTVTSFLTIRVNGAPSVQPVTFFPINQNVAYGTQVYVVGGLGPFTWTLLDPTGHPLPPGLAIQSTSTVLSYVVITGTPTTIGTYPFQLQVKDANNLTSTVSLSMTVVAEKACVLNGQFAQLEVGYESDRPFVAAGSYTVDGAGTVSGYQDKSDTVAVAEPVTGTCTTRSGSLNNNGTLTVTGSQRSPTYDYAVTIGLARGRMQLMNGGDKISSSSQLLKQDATAFNLATLAGEWTFGTLGSYAPTSNLDPGTRVAVAGRFSLDASGHVTAGRLDSNGTTQRNAAPFTGTLGAPDAHGRGSLQLALTGASDAYAFVYYVVDANHLFIVQTTGGASGPALAGTLTRQGAGPFDATALGAQGVLSLWTAYSTDTPHSSLALGRLSGAVPGGSGGIGTLTVSIDLADRITATLDKSYTTSPYAVDSDGHATLTYTDSNSYVHSLALYLSGQDAGYVVEHANSNTHDMGGLLEAQVAGPYATSFSGLLVSGTQFPQEAGPMSLLPALVVGSGVIGSQYTSGYLAIDATTSRGIGYVTTQGSSQTGATSYTVDGGNLRLLRYGYRTRGPSLEWLSSD